MRNFAILANFIASGIERQWDMTDIRACLGIDFTAVARAETTVNTRRTFTPGYITVSAGCNRGGLAEGVITKTLRGFREHTCRDTVFQWRHGIRAAACAFK